MSKILVILALMCLYATDSHCQRYNRGYFPISCMEVSKYAKFFVGKCPFFHLDFYDNLESTVSYIKKADPSWSIDQLLRNHIFKDSTKYFRDTYASRKDFIENLNGKS